MGKAREISLKTLLDRRAKARLSDRQLMEVLKQVKALHASMGLGVKIPDRPDTLAEQLSKGKWINAPHLQLISDQLVKLSKKEIRFLKVHMPPRRGKSTLISLWFPLWWFAKFPTANIIMSGYSTKFIVRKFARQLREYVVLYGKELGLETDPTSTSAGNWALMSGGELNAAGIDGSITGMGADLLIIDDYHKGAKEALSKVERDNVWEWWQGTISMRLNAGGVVVMLATRWNQDDLAGRIEKAAREGLGPEFVSLSLPEEAKEDDPLGRVKGELLWPEMFPRADVDDAKLLAGPYNWAAQFQQEPTPEGGAVIKREWIQHWGQDNQAEDSDTPYRMELPDEFDRVIQIWDTAYEKKRTSDFSCGQVWGISGPNVFLLDQRRGKFNTAEVIAKMQELVGRWPKYDAILVEKASSGHDVIRQAQQAIQKVTPVSHRGDSKLARGQATVPLWNAGNIWLPPARTHHWVHEFIDEICTFSGEGSVPHDDGWDCMSYAINYLQPHAWSLLAKRARDAQKPEPPKTVMEMYQQDHAAYLKKRMEQHLGLRRRPRPRSSPRRLLF